MTRLAARLKRVEGDIVKRRPGPTAVRVCWDDELEPCKEHLRCCVGPESGVHHGSVIRLSFGTSDLPERPNP